MLNSLFLMTDGFSNGFRLRLILRGRFIIPRLSPSAFLSDTKSTLVWKMTSSLILPTSVLRLQTRRLFRPWGKKGERSLIRLAALGVAQAALPSKTAKIFLSNHCE